MDEEQMTIAREESAVDDFKTAINRLREDADAASKTEGSVVAVRAEDLKVVLEYDDSREKLGGDAQSKMESAIEAAMRRGGSHATLEIALLQTILRKLS